MNNLLGVLALTDVVKKNTMDVLSKAIKLVLNGGCANVA